MALLYCNTCKRFHESSQPCRIETQSRSGPPTLPGALAHGLLLGVLAGAPFGALTENPVPFAAVAVLVLIVRVAWSFVRQRGQQR